MNADFIISGDTDLLNIRAEVTIPIVTAGEFMDILANSTDESGGNGFFGDFC